MNLFLTAVDLLLIFIEGLIFLRIILSWFPISKDNPFMRILFQLTEPVLEPIRNLIAKSSIGSNMMLDFSPIVAFILISVIRNIIFRLLM